MDALDKIFYTIVILFVCLLLVAFGSRVYTMATDGGGSGQFTLSESEWECTDTSIYYTTMIVGKVPVMQPHMMCIQYSKKQ